MRQNLGVACATLITALAPAIYVGVLGRSLTAGVFAFVIASLWIVLLGLPVFYFLKRRGRIRWWSAIASGFIVGTLPVALYGWPYDPRGSYGYSAWDGHKMVDYVVRGIPTRAGWLQYVHGCCAAGLIGVACAILFWVVWRGVHRSGRRHHRAALRCTEQCVDVTDLEAIRTDDG